MKSQLKFLIAAIGFLTGASAPGAVRVYIQESNAVAWLHYECTGGEVVRAFALDVSVDRGRILGISDFFRGPSTATAQRYGIFPGSFRDHISVGLGTNINWEVVGYSPLAVPADNPDDTLPGLNSSGAKAQFCQMVRMSASGHSFSNRRELRL